MFKLKIFRKDLGIASGFDLGDMQFVFDGGEVSSSEHTRFRMMIYLSVVSLIDGLLALKGNGSFEFVGVDSSFSLRFKLEKKGVLVTSGLSSLGCSSMNELLRGIDLGVEEFVNAGNSLPLNDSVSSDFDAARADLKLAITRTAQ
ncbi:hypothetical protein [Pseudomonas frederiksbergensis]|uniref:Uncharacterized protein n=1 Tax=Pseudomonas frederiksbergensis TaxID=104087 RepID=A0A6L5BXU4_9PSED|nr:hypothetical protein [Pseudomonas frederiksbergensis]KAF2393441.1 hypothetical protein FX983_01406 [Pseudomonas frederiksbergensis]